MIIRGGEGRTDGIEQRLDRWLTEQERRQAHRRRWLRGAFRVFGAALLYGLLLAALETITQATWWAVGVNAAVTTMFVMSTLGAELRGYRERAGAAKQPTYDGSVAREHPAERVPAVPMVTGQPQDPQASG